jgi:PTS system nitrogen regulatory IIA component
MEKLLTIQDVSALLQMSPSTVYKYAEKGKIPSFKIGTCLRFFEEEITNYLLTLSQKQVQKC